MSNRKKKGNNLLNMIIIKFIFEDFTAYSVISTESVEFDLRTRRMASTHWNRITEADTDAIIKFEKCKNMKEMKKNKQHVMIKGKHNF